MTTKSPLNNTNPTATENNPSKPKKIKTSTEKTLSRKDKLEAIREANQLLENVWERIYASNNRKTDAQDNI